MARPCGTVNSQIPISSTHGIPVCLTVLEELVGVRVGDVLVVVLGGVSVDLDFAVGGVLAGVVVVLGDGNLTVSENGHASV